MQEADGLLDWAGQNDIKYNGIKLVRIPGRGIGVFADRHIEAGEVILEVPVKMMRSIDTVPPAIRSRMPARWSIHSFLAIDLCLNHVVAPWHDILPTIDEFRKSLPLLWPPQLQALLPQPALVLVNDQKARIQRQWEVVTNSFPDLTYEQYLRAWLIMNTRTFYHSTPETETYDWVERLALLPVADLLNHAEAGCKVLYSDQEYSITTDRVYAVNEEICNSYGEHTNDFLLGEYGFILAQNSWDSICIDDAILSQLSQAQKSLLAKENLTEGFQLNAENKPCDKTKRAIEILCSSTRQGEPENGDGAGETHSKTQAHALLADYLQIYAGAVEKVISDIMEVENVVHAQRELLLERWRQIGAAVGVAIQKLQAK
ncbi:hypothetical protein BJ166DRAFT_514893 [Pestalotiopsis sp. NC0098]|nr:hypothetical protein BJ166DRAFT_514893 [Pestalotiopsis sp. NC0098]